MVSFCRKSNIQYWILFVSLHLSGSIHISHRIVVASCLLALSHGHTIDRETSRTNSHMSSIVRLQPTCRFFRYIIWHIPKVWRNFKIDIHFFSKQFPHSNLPHFFVGGADLRWEACSPSKLLQKLPRRKMWMLHYMLGTIPTMLVPFKSIHECLALFRTPAQTKWFSNGMMLKKLTQSSW